MSCMLWLLFLISTGIKEDRIFSDLFIFWGCRFHGIHEIGRKIDGSLTFFLCILSNGHTGIPAICSMSIHVTIVRGRCARSTEKKYRQQVEINSFLVGHSYSRCRHKYLDIFRICASWPSCGVVDSLLLSTTRAPSRTSSSSTGRYPNNTLIQNVTTLVLRPSRVPFFFFFLPPKTWQRVLFHTSCDVPLGSIWSTRLVTITPFEFRYRIIFTKPAKVIWFRS